MGTAFLKFPRHIDVNSQELFKLANAEIRRKAQTGQDFPPLFNSLTAKPFTHYTRLKVNFHVLMMYPAHLDSGRFVRGSGRNGQPKGLVIFAMKRELEHNEIRFTTETIQLSDKTWKCEAQVFLKAKGIEVASLGGFDTEQEAESDTIKEVKWLIDFSLRKRLLTSSVGSA